MDENFEKKEAIRNDIRKRIDSFSEKERLIKIRDIENRLFEFANFLESKIALLYVNQEYEVPTQEIIKRCFQNGKIVVLPAFKVEKRDIDLLRVDKLATGMKMGPRGILEPDPNLCKPVPIDYIDIAIIPGIAFDEKGGRIGSGEGYYDRLIPKLPITTRKVALSFESQLVSAVPMESHDKYVDIIISEKRIIYKI
ncbi:MAG: 5-formyltetrahydrofolate cyclo-ligase [Thermodesulfobacteriota bacterium]